MFKVTQLIRDEVETQTEAKPLSLPGCLHWHFPWGIHEICHPAISTACQKMTADALF